MIRTSELCKHRGLIIALAVISVAFCIALYGPHSLFLFAGIVLAFALFWVPGRHRMLYGAMEFAAGGFTLLQQYSVGRGEFSGTFAEAFQTYRWQVVFLTTLAGVYIMVRGLDNISQGWNSYWSKTA